MSPFKHRIIDFIHRKYTVKEVSKQMIFISTFIFDITSKKDLKFEYFLLKIFIFEEEGFWSAFFWKILV